MRIFMFKSASNRGLRAFSGDPGGESLPSKLGPWHAVGVIRPENDPPHKLGRDVIEKAIGTAGYQLWRMKSDKKAAV